MLALWGAALGGVATWLFPTRPVASYSVGAGVVITLLVNHRYRTLVPARGTAFHTLLSGQPRRNLFISPFVTHCALCEVQVLTLPRKVKVSRPEKYT